MNTVKVTSVRKKTVPKTKVFDIGVSDNHNYFVENSAGVPALVHNCHRGNAHEYSRLLSRLRQKHRIGCSATPKRKDGKHFLVSEFIGPVKASASIETLKAKLMVIDTGCDPGRTWSGGPAAWVYACQWLANSKKRNNIIFKAIVRDVRAGRSIVIPLMYKKHIQEMVKHVNEFFYDEFDRNICAAFEGGAQSKQLRKKVIDGARKGDIRVVIGIRSLMQLGLNVPAWDTIYYAMPMSNKYNWEQESCRILTPHDNKMKPTIRMFVDPGHGQSSGCFKQTWRFSMELGYKPTSNAKRMFKKITGDNPDRFGVAYAEGAEYPDKPKKRGRASTDRAPNSDGGLFGRGGIGLNEL